MLKEIAPIGEDKLLDPFRKVLMTFSTLIPAFQLCLRAGIAAAISVTIANLFGFPFPIYAMIAAVIVTDLEPVQTRKLGLQRLVGTVLGASLGAMFSSLLPLSPWLIGFGILAAMFLSYLFRLQDAARVTGYVCGIVLLEHAAEPWSYALHRSMETVLGILTAMLVSLVPKLIRTDKLKR